MVGATALAQNHRQAEALPTLTSFSHIYWKSVQLLHEKDAKDTSKGLSICLKLSSCQTATQASPFLVLFRFHFTRFSFGTVHKTVIYKRHPELL